MTVHVGSPDFEERSFRISEALITSRSDFFRNTLHSGSRWSAGKGKIVHLPEDHPDLFAKYIQLVYTSTIPIIRPTLEDPEDDVEYTTLAHLYVLSRKLQDTHSQNLIIDTMLTKARTRIDNKFFPVISAAPTKSREIENVELTTRGTGLMVKLPGPTQ